MIIYNISLKVSKAIENDWLQWQQTEHITEVMASCLFTEYKFCRLLEQDDEDEATYIVQYFATSFENYKQYITHFAPQLRQKIFDKWGDQLIAFRSVMEVISQ